MIEQDFPPALEKYCLRQLRLAKAVSTSHIQMNIHATVAQQAHSSPASPWKSPRSTAACEAAEILNIARSASPPAILRPKTIRKSILLARGAPHGISAKSRFLMKISKFHHHGWKFKAAITFSKKFSGSSYLHHPNLHIKISDWTKGKRKRSTEFRAQAKKPTKNPK